MQGNSEAPKDGLGRPHRGVRRARAVGVLALALALLTAGCAVMQRDNRRTLNALDSHWAPESTAARWSIAPAAFPLALLALGADAFVVHPCTVFDEAWHDTVRWLWTPRPGESRFRRALITPLAALATPLVYVGDWFGRACFGIKPRRTDTP